MQIIYEYEKITENYTLAIINLKFFSVIYHTYRVYQKINLIIQNKILQKTAGHNLSIIMTIIKEK